MSASKKSYYDLLCVPKSASHADIQKAYRKMALKFHPDREGGNAEIFKELAEAYEALSDPLKRSTYDKEGQSGLYAKFPAFEGVINPLFVFNAAVMIFSALKKDSSRSIVVDKDLPISLQMVCTGGVLETFVYDYRPCHICNGSRVIPKDCIACAKRPSPSCKQCQGFSVILDSSDPCMACAQVGYFVTQKLVEVCIPPGVFDGYTLLFEDCYHDTPDKRYALTSLQLTCVVERHPMFEKHDDSLFTTIAISLFDALSTRSVHIWSVNLKKLHIHLPAHIPNISPLLVLTAIGAGLPNLDGSRGNLHISFNIIFPHDRIVADEKTDHVRKITLHVTTAAVENDEDVQCVSEIKTTQCTTTKELDTMKQALDLVAKQRVQKLKNKTQSEQQGETSCSVM
jgi:DnaJ-class molecular chaperone